MKLTVLGFMLISLFVSVPMVEAGNLSIRLVEASNNESSSSAGLSDVIGMLKKTLAFKSYSIRASSGMTLPAANSTVSLDGYSVTCHGNESQVEIVVRHGKSVLLNTRASLKAGKPLILGGFPRGANKLVLIFVAR